MRQLKNIIFTLLFCFASSAFAASNSLAVTKLGDLLNHFNTFQARFKQQTLDVDQHVIQNSRGTVALMRPGYFRWESELPTHQIVIADGKTLWIYDVDLQQATQQSLQQGPMSPAKLLSGHVDRTLQQFNVVMTQHVDSLIFELTPKNAKKPNVQFKSIVMVFSDDELRQMQIKNNLQQTNVFYFSGVKINRSLPHSLFEFTVPAGVDVLK